jgi:hypothetical protein
MITLQAASVPSWLDYVTLAVAVISSGVIAWQAVMTRSAVQASRDTVHVAEASLRESQLARLEAQVPRVFVSVSGALWTESLTRMGAGKYVEVGYGDEFKLPRDQSVVLIVPFFFEVQNDGPGSVSLLIAPFASPVEEGASRVLGPGEKRQFKMALARPVSFWVELAEAAADESPGALSKWGECASVTVRHVGPRDSDVEEIHEIRLFGTVLEGKPDEEGTWQRLNGPWSPRAMEAVLVPARRVYWRSRQRGEQFEV